MENVIISGWSGTDHHRGRRLDRVFRQATKKFELATSASDAEALVETSLHAVRLEPADVLGRYPHQLSGGQRSTAARSWRPVPSRT